MPQPIQISAVIITYNEERNITRCLDSIMDIADEIIIVDSFSTDKTVELCRERGVRVVQHAFEGYIEQKNYALTLTSHPYILSLDADEAADGEMRKSVQWAKENWKGPAYSFNRLTNYCGKWIFHCGWYPDRKARLFDQRLCKWGGMNPHDKLEHPGTKALHLKGNILHYSYFSIAEHIQQTERFTDIAAKTLYSKGVKPTVIKQFLSPVAKFLKDYFLNLGILDGYYGFTICRISAKATWLKYNKLRRLYH